MKALEAQQEQEERELLEKHTKTGPAASAPASPPRSELSDNSTSQANQGGAAGGGTAPVRSRSGNDLASFGGRGGAARLGSSTGSRTDGGYSGVTTQSVPGSRRQSGEHDDSTLGFENLAIGNRGAQTLKPNGWVCLLTLLFVVVVILTLTRLAFGLGNTVSSCQTTSPS